MILSNSNYYQQQQQTDNLLSATSQEEYNYHSWSYSPTEQQQDETSHTNTSSPLFTSDFETMPHYVHQEQNHRTITTSRQHFLEKRSNLITSHLNYRHFSSNDRRRIKSNAAVATTSNMLGKSMMLLDSDNSNVTITGDQVSTNQNGLDFDKHPHLQQQQQSKRRLRFDIVLEASTAVTQKAEESAITYLNRGQVYGIQLNDKQPNSNETITSTLSITFHSSSHRRIAESYWKFWVSQQKETEARAIDIDVGQCSGISDLKFPSFDKITFNWSGGLGAKLYVRFKCLSTDFSRIKGVKGIPMRTQMESHVEETGSDEVCFCKVKLFRDKGAERKNKDDAKQISKQLEKVYGKANDQSLPLMYNVSLPYSVFGEIPTSSTLDSFEHAAIDIGTAASHSQLYNTKTPARYHTRIMTAPNPLLFNNNSRRVPSNAISVNQPLSAISQPLTGFDMTENSSNIVNNYALTATTIPTTTASTTTAVSASATACSPSTSSAATFSPTEARTNTVNDDFRNYLAQQQQTLTSLPTSETSNSLDIHTNNGPPPLSLLIDIENPNNNSFDAISTTATSLINTSCPSSSTPAAKDIPPLTVDIMYTPNTNQASPTEYPPLYHQQHILTSFENNKKLFARTTHNNSNNRNFAAEEHCNIMSNIGLSSPTNTPISMNFIQHCSQPNTISSNSAVSSIYDVFTPEEIQHPASLINSCSITPDYEYCYNSVSNNNSSNGHGSYPHHQQDYFCNINSNNSSSSGTNSQVQNYYYQNYYQQQQQQQQQQNTITSNSNNNNNTTNIALLQQQLQLHNQMASNIIHNNRASNMLLLSPPPPSVMNGEGGTVKKRRRIVGAGAGGGASMKKRERSVAAVTIKEEETNASSDPIPIIQQDMKKQQENQNVIESIIPSFSNGCSSIGSFQL